MNNWIRWTAALAAGFLFACSVLGILAYTPEREISRTMGQILATFQVTSQVTLVTLNLAIAVAIGIGLAYAAWEAWNRGRMSNVKIRLASAQADKAELDSQFLVTVAPPGSEVYRHVVAGFNVTSDPLHLLPGRVNGERLPFDPDDNRRWLVDKLANGQARGGGKMSLPEPDTAPPPLQPILPVLLTAQRLLLVGASDSGKTTLCKHIIAGRRDDSQIVIIDPHSPSKLLGIDVIGAGRDFEAIDRALQSLILLMTSRYTEVARGLRGYGDFSRVSVFIDEWTGIAKQIEGAGEMLAQLLVESRKAQIHLTIIAHTDQVKTLGIEGEGQLRASFTVCRLIGGNGQDRRAFVDPQAKSDPQGNKLSPVEYLLPGPFAGYPAPTAEVVHHLPDPMVTKAVMMREEGLSYTRIARELFGCQRASGPQINQVRQMIEESGYVITP